MNHRLVKIEPTVQHFVAVCACRWRSRPYTTCDVATSAHDEHRQLNHAKRPTTTSASRP